MQVNMAQLYEKLVNPQLVVSFQKYSGVDSSVWHKTSSERETGQGHNMAGEAVHLNGMHVSDSSGHHLKQRLEHRNGFKLVKSMHNGALGTNGAIANGHSAEHLTGEPGAARRKEGIANAKVAMVAELLNDTLGENLRTDSEVDFSIHNKFLYYLFNVGANLGNEAFYILFFPTLIWNVDGWIARRMLVFWCLYMYIGQATKDILKIPRPPSPPVVRIEKRYALEYGMPSTHAMTGLGMPFTILYLAYGRYDFPFVIGLALAAVWCVAVSLSRLYLGMHTVLDIVAGLLFTLFLMPIYYFWAMEAIDDLTLNNAYAPVYLMGVPLICCLTYPKLEQWSTARGDTTLVLGTGVGQALGHWWSKCKGIMHPGPAASAMPLPIGLPTLNSFCQATVRLLIGTTLLVVVRFLVKTIVFEVSCCLSGIDRKDPRAKEQLAVELPCKYITYISISLCCVLACPFVFEYLNVQRHSFYHEL